MPDLVRNAYLCLAYDWDFTKKAWKKNHSPTPPVMISVCNTTSTAARIEYSFLNNKLDFWDGAGEDLTNADQLLRIDSKVMNEAESRLDVNVDPSQIDSLSDKSEKII